MVTTTLQIQIENGAILLPLPAGDKNWIALIENDPSGRGGIGRKFASRVSYKNGRASPCFIVDDDIFYVGAALEFGADKVKPPNPFVQVSYGEIRDKNRIYAVVTSATESVIIIEEYLTAKAAIKAASKIIPEVDPLKGATPSVANAFASARVRSLRETRLSLLSKLAEVEKELASIESETNEKPMDENLI